MKQIIIFVGTFLVCALLLQLAVKICSRKSGSATIRFNSFPSGKELPEDAELVRFSKEQLESYCTDDLVWLENYAQMKKNEADGQIRATLWDDLLRRIDIAMNGF